MNIKKKKNRKQISAFHAAEVISLDLSLLRGKKFSTFFDDSEVKGLLSVDDVEKEVQQLKRIDVDSYIQRVVNPSESKKRPSAQSKTVYGIQPIIVKLRSKYAFLHLTVFLWLHLWIHLEQLQMQKQIWRISLTAFHF